VDNKIEYITQDLLTQNLQLFEKIFKLFLKKNNEQIEKRDIFLVDLSNTEVRLTLWGNQAHSFIAEIGEVIAIKGATVKKFRGIFQNYLYFYISYFIRKFESICWNWDQNRDKSEIRIYT
jgi:ssDNA-binding replication factor A large subunit